MTSKIYDSFVHVAYYWGAQGTGIGHVFLNPQEGKRYMDKHYRYGWAIGQDGGWKEELPNGTIRWWELKSSALLTELPTQPGIVRMVLDDELT